MIARSTFESRDTKKLFGPLLPECRCQKKYSKLVSLANKNSWNQITISACTKFFFLFRVLWDKWKNKWRRSKISNIVIVLFWIFKRILQSLLSTSWGTSYSIEIPWNHTFVNLCVFTEKLVVYLLMYIVNLWLFSLSRKISAIFNQVHLIAVTILVKPDHRLLEQFTQHIEINISPADNMKIQGQSPIIKGIKMLDIIRLNSLRKSIAHTTNGTYLFWHYYLLLFSWN